MHNTIKQIHSHAEAVASVLQHHPEIGDAPAGDEQRGLVDVERAGESLLQHDVELEYNRRVEAEREASLKVCSCGVHCRFFGSINVDQSWRCLNK